MHTLFNLIDVDLVWVLQLIYVRLLCKVLQPLDKLSRRLLSQSYSASEMVGGANATVDFLSATRTNSDTEVAVAIKAVETPALGLIITHPGT